ncbi:MAG: tRNA (adenosine(37)-N6)-threonylcarbamoyltransferase complex dimerization subunit type 1 TsaB [Bacilli bacterium]|jgi:tRNA threonylcarbamoyladenosine biosynthesis protein TsaB|nr:tRNA (adenosine(37)-N6)-threonylcarbamoyltransferase complex dimerization subunit type 1 TsaB [Bacilli bacterium]
MKTLFIDTSSFSLTVSLIIDDKVYRRDIESINEHSKYALTELNALLKDLNVNLKEIDKIMVINGPGSFTGLRIGVTIAKTIGWSLNKNVIPISSLKAYALSNKDYDYYIPMIDARRDCVYGAIYDRNYNCIFEDQYVSIDKLKGECNKLNGNKLLISSLNIDDNTIKPHLDILSIYNYYKDNKGVNAHKLIPNYLKKVEAEEKRECNND